MILYLTIYTETIIPHNRPYNPHKYDVTIAVKSCLIDNHAYYALIQVNSHISLSQFKRHLNMLHLGFHMDSKEILNITKNILT